jgi:hypothetical protein
VDAKYYNGEPEERHNPNGGAKGAVTYVCVDCKWTGIGGVSAIEHHVLSGHAVRGRRWPTSWPNAQFCGEERRANNVKRSA